MFPAPLPPRLLRFPYCCIGLSLLPCMTAAAQKAPPTPTQRLAAAHALYYTPTTQGLRSFHCEADVAWKPFLETVSGATVKADDPALVYLQSVHLGVTDNLRGAGSLDWATAAAAPAGKQTAVAQIQSGLQQMVGGFFQTWNQYMNGSMIPTPDAETVVTASGEGFHIRGAGGGTVVDEEFSKEGLLTATKVDTKEQQVLAVPHFTSTPEGFLVDSVDSTIKQSAEAGPVQVNFSVQYAMADGFRLPSAIHLDIKNVLSMNVKVSACKVTKGTADSAK